MAWHDHDVRASLVSVPGAQAEGRAQVRSIAATGSRSRSKFACRPGGWARAAAPRLKPALALAIVLATSACASWFSSEDAAPASGTPGFVSGFLGGVVADEPSAALVGRQVLAAGGTAADAAVAVGFALAVTLPSRAGLGGGGACLVYGARARGPNKGLPEALLFLPSAPSAPGVADRPAAAPMLPRALFMLNLKYGNRVFASLIAPAEQLARDGATVSRALAGDLAVVAGPLAADPSARAVFFPAGAPVAEGGRLVQPGLGATLAQLRVAGVGDFYQGSLAHILADAAHDAGGGLTVTDLRAALPKYAAPLSLPAGPLTVAFLPPPADGGLAAAAAWQTLAHDPAATAAAGARAISVAARWRQSGGDPLAMLADTALPPASLPALPASTTFATLDRDGNAVVCALTMGNLFGTGRLAAGTGILLAASPAAVPPPLLAAAIAYDPSDHAFHAAVGGSGQEGAPLAAASALAQALAGTGSPRPVPVPVPEPGRANAIACDRGLPDDAAACAWSTDPRGSGLALGQSS
jgi:gamma-glutamyltranspeptidase/glutathione hydrolase